MNADLADSTGSDAGLARAALWLEQVLSLMELPTIVKVQDQQLQIDDQSLSPLQIETLLGSPRLLARDGSDLEASGITLDALQYLANTLLNLAQPESEQRSYTVELAGYRQQRQVKLQEMALAAIEQVRQTQQDYEFKSLSAAERRQVHVYLEHPDFQDLETFSRGKEPDRRLVIRLATDPQA